MMLAATNHSIAARCPLEDNLRYAVGATRAYFTPIMVLIGLVGNAAILAIFILESRLTRWNRFGIYCSALAVSDFCVLLFSGLLDDFLGRGLTHAYGRPVVAKLDAVNGAACKSLEFLQNYFLFASAHLLIAFTLDRLLGVWRPLKFAVRSCVYETLWVVAGIAIAGLALTAPVAAVYDVSTVSSVGSNIVHRGCHVAVSCNATAGRTRLAHFVVYYKGFGVFVVPFLLQAALSAALVFRLLRIRRRRKELMSPVGSSAGEQQAQRMELSRFYANLALSLVSCLLVCPLCVAIVMRANCGLCAPRGDCRCRYLEQLTKLLDSLQDASFAVGFWVYLACVRSFRRRVVFACAVLCVRGGLARLCPASWPAVIRARELVDLSDRRHRPSVYASSIMRKQLLEQRASRQGSSATEEGGRGAGQRLDVGSAAGARKELEMQLLASPNSSDD